MKTNENSLQTATRWAGNGVKLVYAGYAAHSLLFPKQPEPGFTKATRDLLLEADEETFENLPHECKMVEETIKEALAVTLDDEDNYVLSAQTAVEELEELWESAHALTWGSAWPSIGPEKRAKAKAFRDEVEIQLNLWRQILATRKRQAYLAEQAILVKTGAKSAAMVQLDNFGYASGKVAAAVAWTVLIGGVLFLIGGTIYSLCGGTFPQPQ